MIQNAFKVKNGLIVDGDTLINGFFQFNTGYTATTFGARVYYDRNTDSIAYFPLSYNNNQPVHIGQENFIRVFNRSGSQINNGQPVSISGTTNGIPSIVLANASDMDRGDVSGLASGNIPNNSIGFITSFGVLNNINLTGFTLGDEIFLSDTRNGGFMGRSSLDINPTSKTTFIGWVINTGLTGDVLVKIQNEDIGDLLTLKERNLQIGDIASNGVYSYSGITLTTPISGTTFNISPVRGWVVDNITNPNKPILNLISYSGGTGLTSPFLTTNTQSYILLTTAATINVINTPPTPKQRRENIYLGKIGHPNRASFNIVFNDPDYILSPLSQLRDVFTPIRLINDGVKPSHDGSNLSFQISNGTLYGLGINYTNDNLNPNSLFIPSQNPTTFQYRTQTGGSITNVTLIDPTNYDVNGTITPVGGGTNSSTNQRIYLLQNGSVRIQYGQVRYNSLDDAIAGIENESFNLFPNWKDNAILIGVLSVIKTATDLSQPTQAKFFLPSKFGEMIGGVASSSSASGLSGISGLIGVSGLNGISGLSGISGNVGISGLSGLSGSIGISGISGLSGTFGISGLSGLSGVSGLSGTIGISGLSGLSGSIGISGISGLSGLSGSIGVSGISGISGNGGLSGLSGSIGISGISGLSGSIGVSGSIGISGLSGVSGLSATNLTRGIVASFDGGGSDILVGSKTQISLPYNLIISSWTILSDSVGSIVIDVWKSDYSTYPPTAANSITGTEKPTLSSSDKNNDNSLTTWTTNITSGDTLIFNVESCSGIKNVTLIINGL